MKKSISSNAETLLNYGLYSLVLTALAGIGFFFKVWEPAAVLFFSSIIVAPILVMNLYAFTKPEEGKPMKVSSLLLMGIGRLTLLIINVVVSGVMIKFTDGIGEKFRMLYVLLTFIPVALAFYLFYKQSKRNGNDTLITKEAMEDVEMVEQEIIDGDNLTEEVENKTEE